MSFPYSWPQGTLVRNRNAEQNDDWVKTCVFCDPKFIIGELSGAVNNFRGSRCASLFRIPCWRSMLPSYKATTGELGFRSLIHGA